MYRSIRVFALVTFFLLLCVGSYAQNLDLIVTTKGDSIACHIDSISDTDIFYEMKSHGKWIHTHLNKEHIAEFSRDAIDLKAYIYEQGTSIIKSSKPASLGEIPKNSVYAGILSISYSRMIPLGERLGITISGGVNFVPALFDDGLALMLESTFLTGGGIRHFFEPGIMWFFHADNTGPIIRAGYRYQGAEGFLLRAGILINNFDELGVGPSVSLGYSF